MRMYDIIHSKRNGNALSSEEIDFFINGYTNGEIQDYQASALLMAIYFNGMNEAETASLTSCMAHSGDMIDLSAIDGIKVDKHSTGGVGDKTTLVVAPIVASCGVKVAKMSGRGLGHTGGTIDKLEAIPNFKTAIPNEEFFDIVRKIGLCVVGQTGNLAPADKMLYALRDVTATVESIPLIASSIMSKKIAAGSDCILLDVKVGSGAFMKTMDNAISLAKAMVSIGENMGRKTVALITNMDMPLGNAIGNSLEVIEAIQALEGKAPKDLTEICISLATNMLYIAQKGTIEECEKLVIESIKNGNALKSFKEMVKAQGGDVSVVENTDNFKKANFYFEVRAKTSGYIASMDTEKCGIASVVLGAGRETKESVIDYSAGIVLGAKIGSYIKEGETLATLYSNNKTSFAQAEKDVLDAIKIAPEKQPEQKLILARVEKDSVEIY